MLPRTWLTPARAFAFGNDCAHVPHVTKLLFTSRSKVHLKSLLTHRFEHLSTLYTLFNPITYALSDHSLASHRPSPHHLPDTVAEAHILNTPRLKHIPQICLNASVLLNGIQRRAARRARRLRPKGRSTATGAMSSGTRMRKTSRIRKRKPTLKNATLPGRFRTRSRRMTRRHPARPRRRRTRASLARKTRARTSG